MIRKKGARIPKNEIFRYYGRDRDLHPHDMEFFEEDRENEEEWH